MIQIFVCGNGLVEGNEMCDAIVEGSLPVPSVTIEDQVIYGCSSDCNYIMPGFTCTNALIAPETVCTTTCGDGLKVGFEICDDGNNINTDGCYNNCTIDP